MRKLKFKPTKKTVDFFNKFNIVDSLSVEEMLNRILCCTYNQDPFEAAVLLSWYALISKENLDDRQTVEVFLSLISSLICCTINDEFSLDDALETLTLSYKDITKFDVKNADEDFELEFKRGLPEKIAYDKKLKVQLAPPAMNIKKYSRRHGITIAQAIEKRIEEMSPNNQNAVKDLLFQRVIYATVTQNQIQVCSTIFLLSAFFLTLIEDVKPFEQYIEELRDECTENMKWNHRYRKIEELKEKIYRNN